MQLTTLIPAILTAASFACAATAQDQDGLAKRGWIFQPKKDRPAVYEDIPNTAPEYYRIPAESDYWNTPAPYRTPPSRSGYQQMCRVEMFDDNGRFVGSAYNNWDGDFVINGITVKCDSSCQTRPVQLPRNWSVKGISIRNP